jgi:hypothetical protein
MKSQYHALTDQLYKSLRLLKAQEVKMILYRTAEGGVREEVLDPSLDDLKDSVILSGSFNPLHEGHVKLLEHSVAQSGRK